MGRVKTVEAERELRPLETFSECTDCPELVVLPKGKFAMGSSMEEKGHLPTEAPQHQVTIDHTFAVSKYDVTSQQWEACVKGGGCTQSGYSAFGREKRPVTNISWSDAQEYAAWLTRLTGRHYRLLSEAEWEYAARAGTTTRFYFGEDETKTGDYAWYASNSAQQTHPVGEKLPNKFGLYDMAGNVWEWCDDEWHTNYEGAPQDGSVWREGNPFHVLRGGSWWDAPERLRSAHRNYEPPSMRSFNIGFRVARTLLPPGP